MFDISESNKELLSSFANQFIKKSGAKKCLQINHSEFNLFENLVCEELVISSYKTEQLPASGSWDIMFGDFPLGARALPALELGSKLPYSLSMALAMLSSLNDGGYFIFGAEPSALINTAKQRDFRGLLKPLGFQVVGIFNTPKSLLGNLTAIRMPIIVVKKGEFNQEFIGELDSIIQVEKLVESFFNNEASNSNLLAGIRVPAYTFETFSKWQINEEIKQLQTEYKTFAKKKISEIAVQVNLCRTNENFEETPNSIYLPKLGTSKVTKNINELKIKHQNLIQIVCIEAEVDCDYLVAFFESRLGSLIIDSLRSKTFIPSISKVDVMQVEIALPPLSLQKEIVRSIEKLNYIKEKINLFETNLALNPTTSHSELVQIDSILEAVGELTNPEKIKSLIRSGESKTIEFKQTFCLDVEKKQKDTRIEDAAIKTIAAFLNSDGGTLLVGVHDSGLITGNEDEIKLFFKSSDKFLLHIKNRIKTRIGEQFYPFINQDLVMVDSKLILMVECVQSSDEVFVDDRDFYVRTNPATDKLEGRKLSDYIKHRFKRPTN